MSDKRSKKRKRHPLKAFFKFILILLLVVLVIVGAYIAYVFIDYHRLPDHQQLDVKDGASLEAKTGETYKIISFNTGFGAYEPDYSFFMDGGTQSWAWSKERLTANVDNIKSFVEAQNADIVVMQEVDEDATRTYHVNERKTYEDAFSDFDTCFAQNWDSPFLFYPVQQPHGKTVTGILTLSSFDMQSAERRSVPVEDSVMKIVDLDRCYSKSYLTVEGGKILVLYNLHLSAYTSDGTIADKQLDMLLDDIIGRKKEDAEHLCKVFLGMIKGDEKDDAVLSELDDAIALRDISHMPARVKCAVLAWHTADEMLAETSRQL